MATADYREVKHSMDGSVRSSATPAGATDPECSVGQGIGPGGDAATGCERAGRAAGGQGFADWLRRELAARGWAQADLEARLGVPPETVRRWLAGTSRPEAYNRERIARALGLAPDALPSPGPPGSPDDG